MSNAETGSVIGGVLRPPILRGYFDKGNQSTNLDEVKQMITDLVVLQQMESVKKVTVSQRDITNSQKDYYKQTEIVTL